MILASPCTPFGTMVCTCHNMSQLYLVRHSFHAADYCNFCFLTRLYKDSSPPLPPSSPHTVLCSVVCHPPHFTEIWLLIKCPSTKYIVTSGYTVIITIKRSLSEYKIVWKYMTEHEKDRIYYHFCFDRI